MLCIVLGVIRMKSIVYSTISTEVRREYEKFSTDTKPTRQNAEMGLLIIGCSRLFEIRIGKACKAALRVERRA
jgi:hypothetical protein